MRRDQAPLLFAAIRGNAVFSGLCGALMALASGSVAAWLGVAADAVVLGIGVGLLAFSLRLFLIGRAGSLERAEAWVIIGGDLAWVAFSVVLLTGYASAFSALGQALIAAAAVAVLALAALQFAGVRRAARGA